MGPGFQLPSLGLSRMDALSMTLDEAVEQIRLLELEKKEIMRTMGSGQGDVFAAKDPDGYAE